MILLAPEYRRNNGPGPLRRFVRFISADEQHGPIFVSFPSVSSFWASRNFVATAEACGAASDLVGTRASTQGWIKPLQEPVSGDWHTRERKRGDPNGKTGEKKTRNRRETNEKPRQPTISNKEGKRETDRQRERERERERERKGRKGIGIKRPTNLVAYLLWSPGSLHLSLVGIYRKKMLRLVPLGRCRPGSHRSGNENVTRLPIWKPQRATTIQQRIGKQSEWTIAGEGHESGPKRGEGTHGHCNGHQNIG